MLKQIFKFYPRRNFSNSIVWKNSNKEVTSPQNHSSKSQENPNSSVKIDFTPNEFEKLILVLSGKYKSKDEIPPRIGYSTLDTAKSKVRIKLSNILMVASLALCGYYIWRGKERVKSGETIVSIEMEKNRKILEKSEKEKENKLK